MRKKTHFFGDARLLVPFRSLIWSMSTQLSVILRRLSKNHAQEKSFGSFINHPSVTPSRLIQQYWQDRNVSWSGKHLLLYQDSSVLSFKNTKPRTDLGYVGKGEVHGGFELHNSLLVDAQSRACYGIGGAQVHSNEFNSVEHNKQRKRILRHVSFSQKETYRWYSTIDQSTTNCAGASRYTVIADQEADIYELFSLYKERQWDWLIRATDYRRVRHSNGSTMLLSQFLQEIPVSFSYQTQVSTSQNRTSHQALLRVKFSPITMIKSSKNPTKSLPDTLCMYVIDIREDDTSVLADETPIHWVLVSSHAVTTDQEAAQLIEWYCERWNIEQLYRTEKTQGLNIEQAQLETTHGLANLAVVSIMAAAQVMALVMARDPKQPIDAQIILNQQEIECSLWLNPTLEGKTDKQKNQHPPNSLAFVAWVVARLGGWSPHVNKPAGPITMIHGLVRFKAIVEGFALKNTTPNQQVMGLP